VVAARAERVTDRGDDRAPDLLVGESFDGASRAQPFVEFAMQPVRAVLPAESAFLNVSHHTPPLGMCPATS
jgi:hypothetical protein